jgi:hypothetical protein
MRRQRPISKISEFPNSTRIAMRKLLTFLIALAVVGVSASSFAQVGQIPAYIQPPPSGGGGPLTFTWTDSGFASGTPAPPQGFATKAIGTASSDRFVVVTISNLGAASSASKDITSVTVNPGGGAVSLTQPLWAVPEQVHRNLKASGTAMYLALGQPRQLPSADTRTGTSPVSCSTLASSKAAPQQPPRPPSHQRRILAERRPPQSRSRQMALPSFRPTATTTPRPRA